jgi:hypothetical protein
MTNKSKFYHEKNRPVISRAAGISLLIAPGVGSLQHQERYYDDEDTFKTLYFR